MPGSLDQSPDNPRAAGARCVMFQIPVRLRLPDTGGQNDTQPHPLWGLRLFWQLRPLLLSQLA